jgi:hypothetical protein
MAKPSNLEVDLKRLSETVEDFCVWIETLPAQNLRPREWGPREALAHLVYWHTHYLSQSKAVLAGKPLPLPAGRFSDLNAAAIAKFRALTPPALVRRFRLINARLCLLARSNDPHKIALRIKQDSQLWKLSDLIPAAEAHIRNHKLNLQKHR